MNMGGCPAPNFNFLFSYPISSFASAVPATLPPTKPDRTPSIISPLSVDPEDESSQPHRHAALCRLRALPPALAAGNPARARAFHVHQPPWQHALQRAAPPREPGGDALPGVLQVQEEARRADVVAARGAEP